MVSILVDERLQLRSYLPEHAEGLFSAIQESREHLSPWLGWVPATTQPQHSLDFIQQSLHQLEVQEALALGIFYDNVIVGGIGLHDWSHRLKKAQLGYWIAKPFEGKGLVTRSAQRLVEFAFRKLDLNRFEIYYVAENSRSAAVAQRLGARPEGLLREAGIRDGKFVDIVVASILKREFF